MTSSVTYNAMTSQKNINPSFTSNQPIIDVEKIVYKM